MNALRQIVVVCFVLAIVACSESSPTPPSDPKLPPPPNLPVTHLATVTSSTVNPNPAKAGQMMTVSLTFGVTNGATSDSIYWNSNFGPVGGPPDAIPPGTLTPRSGGPLSSGATVVLTYATTAPVSAVLNVVTSQQPFTLGNTVPSDGSVSSIFLNVQ